MKISKVKNNKKAQALMELAILGALLFAVISIMVSEGLGYNYTQQIAQRTFRKAMALAKQRVMGTVTYIHVRDRHTPDISDSFGTGTVDKTASIASVMRNFKMLEVPSTLDELPAIAIDIEGTQNCPGGILSAGGPPPCYFLTAGFRDVYVTDDFCTKPSLMEKYEFIYGAYNVYDYEQHYDDKEITDPVNPWISIIDSCDGEILSYSGCVQQCKMIVDAAYCLQKCQEYEGTNCSRICDRSGDPIEIPWYCENNNQKLEQLFSFVATYTSPEEKHMGLQDNYTQTFDKSNTMRKTESDADITTTDNFNWSSQFRREIAFRQYGDTSGSVFTSQATNTVNQNRTRTWKTNWQ